MPAQQDSNLLRVFDQYTTRLLLGAHLAVSIVTFSTLTDAKRHPECCVATFALRRLETALEIETCCPWIIRDSALDGFFKTSA